MSEYVSRLDSMLVALSGPDYADDAGEPAFVYIVADTASLRPVKVGVTRSLANRLRELQSGNHRRLQLCIAFEFKSRAIAEAVEQLVHEKYAEHRKRGEWFDIHESQVSTWIMRTFREFVVRCRLSQDD